MVSDKDNINKSYLSKIWNLNNTREGNLGAYSEGFGISSPIYFGFRRGNSVERLGWNHSIVQDFFQNGWHKLVMPTPYFQSGDYSNLYINSSYYNPFTIY